MKVAIVGSRGLEVKDFSKYLPDETSEIISGGAKGIDSCAKQYALLNNIKYTEFLIDYKRYGKGAPLKRNLQIIDYSDYVIAFWDGKSKGTKFIIDTCEKNNVKIDVRISLDNLIYFSFKEISDKDVQEFLSLDDSDVELSEKFNARIKNLLDERFGKNNI